MSAKQEQLAELLAAGADIRQKRQAVREAMADLRAAQKHLDTLLGEGTVGQTRLPFKRPDDEPKSEVG
jgi:outer membrane protein TolC